YRLRQSDDSFVKRSIPPRRDWFRITLTVVIFGVIAINSMVLILSKLSMQETRSGSPKAL
ncbi:MAG: hypothetical protein KAV87_25250, partial [Desulfobacteraceae bacterium]|nr:hypothetical protein [Desulfobacteraceae bacterium]